MSDIEAIKSSLPIFFQRTKSFYDDDYEIFLIDGGNNHTRDKFEFVNTKTKERIIKEMEFIGEYDMIKHNFTWSWAHLDLVPKHNKLMKTHLKKLLDGNNTNIFREYYFMPQFHNEIVDKLIFNLLMCDLTMRYNSTLYSYNDGPIIFYCFLF